MCPSAAQNLVPGRVEWLHAELLDEQAQHILQRDPARGEVRGRNVCAKEVVGVRDAAPHGTAVEVKVWIADQHSIRIQAIGMPVKCKYFPDCRIIPCMITKSVVVGSGLYAIVATSISDNSVVMVHRKSKPFRA